jgi:hypothetical protein
MKPQTEILMPYNSVEDIGFIFVYLCDAKGRYVSYTRLLAADFMNPNAELQWIEFEPDPVLKEIKSPEKSGLCSFRLSIVKGSAQQVMPFAR